MKNPVRIVLLVIILSALIIGLNMLLTRKKQHPQHPHRAKEISKSIPVSTLPVAHSEDSLILPASLVPVITQPVSFDVKGKLEHIQQPLIAGMKFHKGQLLAQVDNSELFYELAGRKRKLADFTTAVLPEITKKFPAEKTKWEDFLALLKPTAILPELPGFNSPEEREYMRQNNVLPDYYLAKQLEERMKTYFFVAPFDGVVLNVLQQPGSVVGPGIKVAGIAANEKPKLKVTLSQPASESLVQLNTNVMVADKNGIVIGTGVLIRSSGKNPAHGAVCFYAFKAGKKYIPGTPLTVRLRVPA